MPNRTIEALVSGLPGPRLPVSDEAPFSSGRKWSGLAFADGGLPYGALVLGAPEVLTPHLRADPGIAERTVAWSGAGLRVLLLAGTPGPARFSATGGAPLLPSGLVPLGLVSLADELRPKVAETLHEFADVGIEVKVISGDDPRTVRALATQAGLQGDLVTYSGAELARFDEHEFARGRGRGRPSSAASRRSKRRRSTAALRKRGRYVAMIGDGVNDVIALKRADLGIAMESGSPATRGVADLILMGDSFGVLPSAFREGQRIRNGMQDILNIFAVRIFSRALVIPFVALIGGFAFSPRQSALLSYLTATVPTIGLIVWAHPARRSRAASTGRWPALPCRPPSCWPPSSWPSMRSTSRPTSTATCWPTTAPPRSRRCRPPCRRPRPRPPPSPCSAACCCCRSPCRPPCAGWAAPACAAIGGRRSWPPSCSWST